MTRSGRALAAGAAFALLLVAALCGAADCPGYCAACTPCPACPACPSAHVPPGYEFFPGLGYYRHHLVGATWFKAKEICELEGAHLIVINSQDEADLIQKFRERNPDAGAWILVGFHDLYKEGVYTTVLGQPVSKTGYYVWDANEPNNYNDNEDCGSQNNGLNDINCETPVSFICELGKTQAFGPLG